MLLYKNWRITQGGYPWNRVWIAKQNGVSMNHRDKKALFEMIRYKEQERKNGPTWRG